MTGLLRTFGRHLAVYIKLAVVGVLATLVAATLLSFVSAFRGPITQAEGVTIVLAAAGSLAGAAAFYLNVLRIRELQAKLRQTREEEEKRKHRIYTPNMEDVQKYSTRGWETAVRRARSTNVAIGVLAAFALSLLGYVTLGHLVHPDAGPADTSISDGIRVFQPTSGAEVAQGAVVEFRSVFEDLNHYVVVVPMQSPNRWIVDGPIRVLRDQVGTGRARFGQGSVGVGEEFSVSVLATRLLLPEGVLLTPPRDAKISPQVTVRRAI